MNFPFHSRRNFIQIRPFTISRHKSRSRKQEIEGGKIKKRRKIICNRTKFESTEEERSFAEKGWEKIEERSGKKKNKKNKRNGVEGRRRGRNGWSGEGDRKGNIGWRANFNARRSRLRLALISLHLTTQPPLFPLQYDPRGPSASTRAFQPVVRLFHRETISLGGKKKCRYSWREF